MKLTIDLLVVARVWRHNEYGEKTIEKKDKCQMFNPNHREKTRTR
jgi:hypothetical protein